MYVKQIDTILTWFTYFSYFILGYFILIPDRMYKDETKVKTLRKVVWLRLRSLFLFYFSLFVTQTSWGDAEVYICLLTAYQSKETNLRTSKIEIELYQGSYIFLSWLFNQVEHILFIPLQNLFWKLIFNEVVVLWIALPLVPIWILSNYVLN